MALRTALMSAALVTAVLLGSIGSLSVQASERSFRGRVVAISDGDTIKVMHHGSPEKIRLSGIDCPEKRQPFGNRAKEFTATLAFKQKVSVISHGHDRYGRTIGDIKLPDGRILNRELVRAGLAWWYRSYAPANYELEELERSARARKIGLWQDRSPTPPWQFRKHALLASASTTN